MSPLLIERSRDSLNLILARAPALWETVAELFDCAPHIVPLWWVNSDEAESPFEDQLDYRLRFPDNIIVGALLKKDLQGATPGFAFAEIVSRQCLSIHNSITSPGLKSGFKTQYS